MANSSPELIRKYQVPSPRYTSYPTVADWTRTPAESEWIESLSESLDQCSAIGRGASIYIHIPFCESLCTYCGCNTRISRSHGVSEPYLNALLKEWELYQTRLGREITVDEIYLGGGTPTFLSAAQLESLLTGILSKVKVAAAPLFSIEADPRVTCEEQLSTLARLGFRRLSLGIQDFDAKVQERVNRVQTEDQVGRVTDQARSHGFNNVNFDLIYGLPCQSPRSIQQTFEAVRRLAPDRISLYPYSHVPWIKPAQRGFFETDLPSFEEKAQLLEECQKFLAEDGFYEIGMGSFVRKSDPLWSAARERTLSRNFMGYTPRQTSPLIGLGVSALSASWNVFSQNEKILETYQSRVEAGELPILRGHVLTSEDHVLRQQILNLIIRYETSWEGLESQASCLESVALRLKPLEMDGLIEVSPTACKVTELGRGYLRNICMAFDGRYLERLRLSR